MESYKKSNHLSVGRKGEDLAVEYLKKKGFKVIGRNVRNRFGELDVIAKGRDGILIFFEVKTIVCRQTSELKPEDNLTSSKLHKLKKAASFYAGFNQDQINDSSGWRIDLLALTIKENNCEINHYENIA